MALHKDFPQSPHAILDPGIRWFPADEALRESSMEKLMPPLVAELRRKVGRKLGERKGDIEKRGQIFFHRPFDRDMSLGVRPGKWNMEIL